MDDEHNQGEELGDTLAGEEQASPSGTMPRGGQGDPADEPTTESDETLDDFFREGAGEGPATGEAADETPDEDVEAAGEGPAGDEPAEGEDTGDEPEPVKMSEIDAEFLPEGYYKDDSGAVHREDGSFASRDELAEAIEATAEEAEGFFGEDEEETEPEVEPLEIELEDGALEIEVEDDETREELEARLSAAERVEEAEAELEEARELEAEVEDRMQALRAVEQEMETNPVRFVTERMPDERKGEIAQQLLLDDAVLEAVTEKLDTWQRNPSEREKDKLRAERDYYKEDRELEGSQEALEKGQQVVNQLRSMVPEDMSDELGQRFLRDAVAELQEHVRANDLYPQDLTMEEVHRVLEPRYELYGIEPAAASENGDAPAVKEAEPRGEQAQQLAEEAEKHRRTGERLRKARARRKEAAASTPPGAGSGPRGPQLGEDATLDEALDAVGRRA